MEQQSSDLWAGSSQRANSWELSSASVAAATAPSILRRLLGPILSSGHDVIDDLTLGIGVVLNERPFLLSQS